MPERCVLFSRALDDLGGVLAGVSETDIDRACATIARARRIVLHGCGREGLQVRGFCMRLFHLGLDVAMQGDMTTPPVRPGDLFFASSGPGELSTVHALLGQARKAGAATLVVTAQAGSRDASAADQVLLIPAQTMADDTGPARRSVLPMGSVFEGALFVLFEVMVLKLVALSGVTPEAMRARHTNLE